MCRANTREQLYTRQEGMSVRARENHVTCLPPLDGATNIHFSLFAGAHAPFRCRHLVGAAAGSPAAVAQSAPPDRPPPVRHAASQRHHRMLPRRRSLLLVADRCDAGAAHAVRSAAGARRALGRVGRSARRRARAV
eukprot:scaffold26761_cov42-Phaeocystis_antarctica.AAC.2